MKYAMMSDVHSNPLALATALEDAKALGCGKFVFLGDVTGYGYDVKGALKLVRENFNVAILGNHDAISSGLEDSPEIRANSHYDIDREQGALLSDDEGCWLRKRRHVYRNRRYGFACTHGDFVAPSEWGYIMDTADAESNFRSTEEQMLFCGHLHHAMVFEGSGDGQVKMLLEDKLENPPRAAESVAFRPAEGHRYIVNCGSVGNPRFDLCSTYAIYDTASREVQIRRLPFDFKGFTLAMVRMHVPLPAWLVQLLHVARGVYRGNAPRGSDANT